MSEYERGGEVSVISVLLAELKQYPIWLIDEESENQDVLWVRPILNSTNVGKGLAMTYILLKVKGTDIPTMGLLDLQNMIIDDPYYWSHESNNWEEIRQIAHPFPIHMVSVPSILNQPNMEFVIERNWTKAKKV